MRGKREEAEKAANTMIEMEKPSSGRAGEKAWQISLIPPL